MNDATNDLVQELMSLKEIFQASSIVTDKSTNVKDSSQIKVLIYARNSNICVNEERLDLIPMPGKSSREDILCETDN
jgi:hypothetical protein